MSSVWLALCRGLLSQLSTQTESTTPIENQFKSEGKRVSNLCITSVYTENETMFLTCKQNTYKEKIRKDKT